MVGSQRHVRSARHPRPRKVCMDVFLHVYLYSVYVHEDVFTDEGIVMCKNPQIISSLFLYPVMYSSSESSTTESHTNVTEPKQTFNKFL